MMISYLLALFLFIICNKPIFASEIDKLNNNDLNIFWKTKLEYAFNKTFSNAHEFAACQAFQKLGYDLAEISQIRRITPFPASLTVVCDGFEEDNIIDSSNNITKKIIKLCKLNVICEKVHYFDMQIDKMTFSFPNSSLEIDYLEKGKLKFFQLDRIELNIKVSEQDILSVLKLYPKSKLLNNVKVSFDNNKCTSIGKVKLGILIAEFKLIGHINQISSKKVNFICDKLYINRIAQPRAFISSIMGYINPVFDSTKLWVNLKIREMKLINKYVETNATIDKKGI